MELQSISGRGIASFFVEPNHVFMQEVDYLALVQGVLLTTFPDLALTEIAREGRRIWLEDNLVLHLRCNDHRSSQRLSVAAMTDRV